MALTSENMQQTIANMLDAAAKGQAELDATGGQMGTKNSLIAYEYVRDFASQMNATAAELKQETDLTVDELAFLDAFKKLSSVQLKFWQALMRRHPGMSVGKAYLEERRVFKTLPTFVDVTKDVATQGPSQRTPKPAPAPTPPPPPPQAPSSDPVIETEPGDGVEVITDQGTPQAAPTPWLKIAAIGAVGFLGYKLLKRG